MPGSNWPYTTSEVFCGGSCARSVVVPRKMPLASNTVWVKRKGKFVASLIDDGLLSCRYRFPYPNRRQGPSHHRRDLAHLRHQFVELIGVERLRAVRQRFIRLI